MKELIVIVTFLAICFQSFGQVNTNTQIAKEVITGFEKGKMELVSRNFDEDMKKAMPQDKLKFLWDDLIRQCGDFQNYTEITTEKIENYTVVYLLCHFKNLNLRMKIVFNLQNQISGLFFIPVN